MTLLNPYVIGAILAALLASFISGGLLGWHEKALRIPVLLEGQRTTDQTECSNAQKLTKDTNDDIQKSDAYIAGRLSALSLQHPAACVPVARAAHIRASGYKHAGQDGNSPATGLNTDWLRSYAADAETYRSELTVCEDFLQKERKELTQPGQ